MTKYKKILLTLVLDPVSDALPIEHGRDLAKQFDAEIFLVHAVEHLSSYGAAYGVAAGADIEEMLMENATEAMNKVADEMGVKAENRILKVGPAKSIILEEAEKVGADLIIVGSHARHGMRLLLGSTANAVLHGAKCDVLAARLQE